ncbi:MAG: YggS family pyridoxal phosphate-dependent enzyme [Nitrospira sp.]|nr:YggS family pyridoxal phosphate-dependent enzyme [Nitrospira sp.]
MEIVEALKNVLENIRSSAVKADRDPDIIKLIAVSKTVELQLIIEAVNAGAAILGENRVQEAKSKIEEFRSLTPPAPPLAKGGIIGGVEWHLIGNLQKNKARTAVELFDLIHSVDSADLAAELNKHAKNAGKVQDVLVQVKLSDEATKHGALEKDIRDLLGSVMEMDNLNLRGLMTIPPFFDDPEKARPFFRKLRQIAETSSAKGFPVNELSMGMSNDYEVAIEEGATMVRVGTAIFGARNF